MHKILARASSLALMFVLTASYASAAPAKSNIAKHVANLQSPAATCVGGSGLSGWYGFIIGGGPQNGTAKYLSGAIYLDGNCNVSGSNLSGGTGSQTFTDVAVTGTYGQNTDSTYTLTLNLANSTTPQTYILGVSESGNKARGIETDNSAVVTLDMQSQLTTLTSGYTTASLTGAYAVSCSGSGVDLNYVTFDGKGNLSGVNPYDNGGTQGNSPYTGTYTVNGDGTFAGALLNGYSGFTFNGVIDNGVNEIQYTYIQAGPGEVVACSGHQSTSSTLQGYYGFVVGGSATTGGGGKYLTGSLYFDGNGNITGTNLNGGLNSQYVNSTATGNYASNGDGTTTITLNLSGQTTAQTYIVAVSQAGNEAVGIETDGTAIATIDLQSQLQLPNATYSLASLNGTYASTCNGAEVDVNYTTFDGNGNISGLDPYDNGSYGYSPYTGTYTVNSDGTFTGNFAGAYAAYTMTGVIDNATGEIEYTYDYSTNGGVVQCVGESTFGPVGTNPVAATPVFTPGPGAYNTPQSVALSDSTPGAVIYYTTDGVPPTTSSTLYSNPIAVSSTTTIQAIAVAPNYNNSAIAAGTLFFGVTVPTAATPTFSPLPGQFTTAQSVTLSDSTPGATIYYTTNGSTPTTGSTVYTGAITVSTTTTINAIAVANGYNNSAVASGTFTITTPAATPTFNPAPGSYVSNQSVTLADTTPGATIYYTTNGSTPTTSSTVYSGPITVSANTTVNAIAVASGYSTSAVASGTYTITGGNTVINLGPYYNVYGINTIGTAPKNGGFDNDSYAYNSSQLGTSLAYQGVTFTLGSANALDAITSQTVPLSGGQFSQLYLIGAAVNGNQKNQSIVVTYTDGSTSTYSVNFSDWAYPQNYSGESTVSTDPNRISPNGQTQTINIYAYGYTLTLTAGKTAASIKLPANRNVVFLAMGEGNPKPTAATPTFSPAPGTYNAIQSVTLSDATPGAVIHYTTNGTTPTASSPVYSSAITVSATTTIEAIAIATGYNNSAVATGVFTIVGTPIVPYIQVNNGSWQQTASVNVHWNSSVNLGPQPLNVGSWSWTGPNGYKSTSRQINNIPLSWGTNTYVATYTNPGGVKSTQTFTINVGF